MSETKWTPGPWWWTDADGWHLGAIFSGKLDDEDSKQICYFGEGPESGHDDGAQGKPPNSADIALMCAAPDLYEALGAALGIFANTFAQGGTVHKQMLAAMSKARGEA